MTELESFEVWSGRPEPVVEFHTDLGGELDVWVHAEQVLEHLAIII